MINIKSEFNRIKSGNINWRRVFFIGVFIAFFLEFYLNIFGIVNSSIFAIFQSDSESYIIGRILASIDEGIFSLGGFLTSDGINAYTSQFGLQGFVFGFIAQFISFLNIEIIMSIFRCITAAMTAVAVTLITYWLSVEFEFEKIELIILPILIIIGMPMLFYSYQFFSMVRVLYWVPFTFFIPMLIMIYINYKKQGDKETGYSFIWLLLIFLSVLLKCLCGFEYITAILIAGSVPLFYYAVKERIPLKSFMVRFIQYSCSALLGFMAGILAYLLKLYSYLGDFKSVLAVLTNIIAKRTYGFGVDVDNVYIESLDASVISVVIRYLFEITPFILTLIIIALLIFVIYLMRNKNLKSTKFKKVNTNTYNKLVAGLTASGIALLAPLSWFVLAKGHSYIHVHLNYCIWYVPFIFIGLALCIYFIKCWIDWHVDYHDKPNTLIQMNNLVLILITLPIPIAILYIKNILISIEGFKSQLKLLLLSLKDLLLDMGVFNYLPQIMIILIITLSFAIIGFIILLLLIHRSSEPNNDNYEVR